MKNRKAAHRLRANEPGFLYVSDVVRDFPVVARFARLCGLPECFEYTKTKQELLSIVAKAKLTANIHIMSPGEIHEKWCAPIGTNSLTVPDAMLDGSWHVVVETIQDGIVPGWLLTSCGHYIEQIASGNGYTAGKYELRGTSFDHAVALASLASGIDAENRELRRTAESLVAVLNGAWLAWHCGIEPAHIAVELMTMVIGNTRSEEKVGVTLLKKFEDILARSIMERHFYQAHVEQIGWTSEKGLCLTMDAATAFLLRRMKDSLKGVR